MCLLPASTLPHNTFMVSAWVIHHTKYCCLYYGIINTAACLYYIIINKLLVSAAFYCCLFTFHLCCICFVSQCFIQISHVADEKLYKSWNYFRTTINHKLSRNKRTPSVKIKILQMYLYLHTSASTLFVLFRIFILISQYSLEIRWTQIFTETFIVFSLVQEFWVWFKCTN